MYATVPIEAGNTVLLALTVQYYRGTTQTRNKTMLNLRNVKTGKKFRLNRRKRNLLYAPPAAHSETVVLGSSAFSCPPRACELDLIKQYTFSLNSKLSSHFVVGEASFLRVRLCCGPCVFRRPPLCLFYRFLLAAALARPSIRALGSRKLRKNKTSCA